MKKFHFWNYVNHINSTNDNLIMKNSLIHEKFLFLAELYKLTTPTEPWRKNNHQSHTMCTEDESSSSLAPESILIRKIMDDDMNIWIGKIEWNDRNVGKWKYAHREKNVVVTETHASLWRRWWWRWGVLSDQRWSRVTSFTRHTKKSRETAAAAFAWSWTCWRWWFWLSTLLQ